MNFLVLLEEVFIFVFKTLNLHQLIGAIVLFIRIVSYLLVRVIVILVVGVVSYFVFFTAAISILP